MPGEKSGFAVAAGIFLLLPLALVLLYFSLFRSLLTDPDTLLYFAMHAFLPGLAGIFLILRKPKLAALVMTLAALGVLLTELPEVPRFLAPMGYLATYDEYSGYAEYIPRGFVAVPILSILAALLFAAALYLRGKAALVVALLSALAELAYLNLRFAAMAYVTGHPGPDALFPLQLALAALFTGLYLNSLKKAPAGKTEEKATEPEPAE